MTDIVQIQESVYDAILRQAVAVIDRTRAMVATTVCSAIGTAHWEIGKLLHDRKIESKHGSGVVNRLSFDLKQRYPQMGVVTRLPRKALPRWLSDWASISLTGARPCA